MVIPTTNQPNSNQHHNLKIIEAKTFIGRLRGLIGRPILQDQSLFFRNSYSLHTCFMSYALDIIFLDQQFQVTTIVRNLKPWRCALDRKAQHFLEIPSKQTYNISVGDTVSVESQIENFL